MTTTFLFPSFNKSENDKVHNTIDVRSKYVLVKSIDTFSVPAVSSEGFPANRDGIYVFVTSVQAKDGYVSVGFTSTKTVDSRSTFASPGDSGINGVCAFGSNGIICGGNGESSERWIKQCLPSAITRTAKEIIAILTFSKNGKKRNVQFIFDANEGPVHELANTDFENKNGGNEIFPVVTLRYKGDQLECIPFDQVKSRSPKIDELMKEFSKNKNIPSSSPSTSTFENDAVISQLRDQVARSQDVVIRENEKQMKNMREMYEKQLEVKDQQLQQQLHAKDQLYEKQLEVKDQQLQQQLHAKDQLYEKQLEVKDQQLEKQLLADRQLLLAKDQQLQQLVVAKDNQAEMKDRQLELERAEHQKTRNLLHQIKMELKDIEIFYLTREKESGQRRQREEESDQFKVKQEPGI